MVDSGANSIASGRPNVVLVHCHDLGRHLGCYGQEVETPNIDALADDGVQFDEYYCTAPQCSPSRGSIMTGRYPHNHGLMGLAHLGWELNDGEKTLPMYMEDIGYKSALFGFQHEAPWDDPERLGYHETHTETTRAREVAEGFIDRLPALADNGPFFASLGFTEPHREFHVDYLPESAYDDYDPDEVEPPSYLPDRPGIRSDIAALRTLITATVDEAIGEVREGLAEAGIKDETLLIFTTDHGVAMPRAKGTCYDSGLGTALLMHLPDVIQNEEVDALTSNVDLLPTLLDLLGESPPDRMDGRSFLPLLTGDESAYENRNRIFAEMTWHDRYNPIRAVRTERYKYVRNFWPLPSVFLPTDVIRGDAGAEVIAEYYEATRPVEELYDLREDPNEQQNLASNRTFDQYPEAGNLQNPKYESILSELREELHQWMKLTEDPLLDGVVSHPRQTTEPFYP